MGHRKVRLEKRRRVQKATRLRNTVRKTKERARRAQRAAAKAAA